MENNKEGGKGGTKCLWLILGYATVVLALAFWWFAWRPAQIKKECFKNERWTAEYYTCLMNKGIDFRLQ
jgi:hypothetical protein